MKIIKKVFFLVSNDKLFEFFSFILLLLFMMILEMFGISLVIPLISLLSNNESNQTNNFFINFSEYITFFKGNILIFTSFFIGCFFVLKFFISLFSIYYQQKYIADIKRSLQHIIFKKLLLKSYQFHLDNNSSELLALNTKEVDTISELIGALAMIIGEIFVVLGIFSILLYISPLPTIIISLCIVIIGFFINFFSKNIISKLGNTRLITYADFIKNIQQGFGGIKDIKILDKENYFINTIINPIQILAKITVTMSLLQSLPRLILELTFILSILIIILSFQGSYDNILPILGLFAVAGFRLMPSANRIISNLQSVTYSVPAVNKVYEYIKDSDEAIINISENRKFIFTESIEIENLSYKYLNLKEVLKSVNITIYKNEFIGIVGESGSGKSTFVNLLIGLLKPDSGYIKADNKNIETMITSWKKSIGYVPQDVYLLDDTLRRNIALAVPDAEIDDEKIFKVLVESDLKKYVDNLSQGINTIVGERGLRISGGEKQRIGIARALYTNPDILIFDESTSSLDYDTENEIIDNLSRFKDKRTIIFISHRKQTLKYCDKIYQLKNFQLNLL